MSAPKKTKECPRCHNTLFEADDQGFMSCMSCGLVRDELKFDNNVVFGEQRQMLGKNINMNGTSVLTLEKENQYSSERRLKRARDKIEDLRRQLEIDSTYDEA